MLLVLSPAKSLDYETPVPTDKHTLPGFTDRSAELIAILRKLSPADIGSLMSISDQLSALNAARYEQWSPTFTTENARQAVLAFNGDVYEGLDAWTMKGKQLDYLQQHVRILSGLYGILRPLDLMQPYRLEMGTKLANKAGKDLYAFWGDTLTQALNQEFASQKEEPVLVNLASEEYFKAVRPKSLAATVISPVFEDFKGGKYKIVSFYAKRARGLMARYAALNGITDPERLKGFDVDGYGYDEKVSTATKWVFRRQLEA